ncbi:ACD1-like protein [Wolffia australiana]
MEALHLCACSPGVPSFAKSSSPSLLHRPITPFRSNSAEIRSGSKLRFLPHAVSSRPTNPAFVPNFENSIETEGEEAAVGEQFDWFDHWYPVAAICDLDKRVPHGKTVLGLDVVVWWDRSEEKWQVFNDLCPHRLAPLSEGRIDQWGRLQCVYHGWCFDGKGDCKFIPQAPAEGPPVHSSKKACAIPYPSCVQNNILWFWPNSDPKFKDILTKKRPPNIPECDDPSYSGFIGTRDLPYGYEVLIENLMDPAHVSYAHYGLMGMPKPKNDKRDREGGKPINITILKHDLSGFTGKQETRYSNFTPPVLFRFLPDLSTISDIDGLKLTEEELSACTMPAKRRLVMVFICIPVSPGRSRLIWVFPRNFAVWVDKIIPRWVMHIGQNLIIDSDLNLLHVEERKIAEIGVANWQKACFVPTKSDGLVVAFRKWLKKYSNHQINWGPKFGTQLPPTPSREQLMDRYWSHTVNCNSCLRALMGLRILETSLQIASVALIAGLAAVKQSFLSSAATRAGIFGLAVLCFLASRWLSRFIYKTFYYHDYNHALV